MEKTDDAQKKCIESPWNALKTGDTYKANQIQAIGIDHRKDGWFPEKDRWYIYSVYSGQ